MVGTGPDLGSQNYTGGWNRPLHPARTRWAWARIHRGAGVTGYSVHGLRHTAATRLVEQIGRWRR